MAKDGTKRGGARPGAGRPRKSKPADPATVISTEPITEEERKSFPKCRDLLTKTLAETIYFSIYRFARNNGADERLPQELVELFAVSYYRWTEVETKIAKEGVLSAHPTTGANCKSPLVSVSETYSKLAQNYWYSIWNIIRDSPTPEPDEGGMEGLLD